MTTTVSRWGNSLGVRIPKEAAEQANLREGDVVEVIAEGGRIVLVPRAIDPSLDDLIDMISPQNVHGEVTVAPTGAEIW